jgi:hypothetical protein
VRRAIALVVATAGLAATARDARADDCHHGDVEARTDSELAVLADKTCLVGTLAVSSDVTSLRALKQLTSIDGSLRIHGTKKLSSLAGLDKLERVTGSITIGGPKRGVPKLRNIDGLNKLVEIGGSLDLRGGYIFIPGKSMIAPINDVTGLRSLQRVNGDVMLFDVRAFRGLNTLVEIGGTLTISHSEMSTLRGFAKLERIGGRLVIQANGRLKAISGLGAVKTIEGDVVAGCWNRNAVLTEKALRAWTDKHDVKGKVVFVGADVPHSTTIVNNQFVGDPCEGH